MLADLNRDPLKGLQVASFGEVLFDMIDDEPHLGGAPLNFAWYASQMGAEVSLLSTVGKDQLGDRALNTILNTKIEAIVTRSELPTGVAEVSSDGSFTIARGKAWENISVPISSGRDLQLLYFGSLAQVSKENRSSLKTLLDRNPKYVFVDLNLRANCYTKQTIEDCLYYATMLKVNEKEWNVVSEITGINEPELLMRRKRLNAMAVTRGGNGATLYSAAGGVEFKPSNIDLVDQTGAGDAFSAVLAVGILINAHPAQALAASCQAGAVVASKKGALVDLPKDILEAYEEDLS
jgi:fructokinase